MAWSNILLLVIVAICCSVPVLGQQRSKSFRHRGFRADSRPTNANLTGDHVCGTRPNHFCCPGWTRVKGKNKCDIPLCRSSCGQGICVRPNICQCPDGNRQSSCIGNNTNNYENRNKKPDCAVNCLNGGTCRTSHRCNCPSGFKGPYCAQPICRSKCMNGGRCIAPNRCACKYGFQGGRCQSDYRTGPCFTQIEDNRCKGQLTGVVCTRVLCCATIGKAWGIPCERCKPNHPCRTGYFYNPKNKNCQDINECNAIPSLCVGGECVNTQGSYRCSCKEGQTRSPKTGQCEDVNECETIPNVCRDGKCHNTESGYFCQCNSGYVSTDDRKACYKDRVSSCYRAFVNGSCGEPTSRKISLKMCCCEIGIGFGTNGFCQLCPARGSDKFQKLCIKSQERTKDTCEVLNNPCGHGKCVPSLIDSTYTCVCNDGYKVDEDGVTCEDANECERSGYCLNGRCINTYGSFKCECPHGFTLSEDGTYCSDMNECEHAGMCPNGDCVNMDGSYKCVCKRGFKQSPDQQICVDLDECAENGKVCLHGKCVNTPGSYECTCDPGFTKSSDGAFCLDENECSKSQMCPNGQCVNQQGGYQCLCYSGFKPSPNNKYCIDINECEDLEEACHNGQCVNNQGSFRCECPLGLTLAGDGRTCISSVKATCFRSIRGDECLNPTSTLVTIAACCCTIHDRKPIGVGWGIPCRGCPEPGTEEYKMYCKNYPPTDTDINECALYPDICENGGCENIPLGYRCRCNPGFIVDRSGKRCVDVDECERGLVCEGGQCHNIPGSYRCRCSLGYQYSENLQQCVDKNECASDQNLCRNAVCVNNPGSFRCECRDPNHTLDSTGRVCIDKRTAMCWRKIKDGRCEDGIGKIHREDCCASAGVAWGSPCELCPKDNLKCPHGFSFQNGLDCKDVNECQLFPNICDGGRCINTPGSFRCECGDGMTLDPDGITCMDMRTMNCYLLYKKGKCSQPFPGVFRKKVCCCTIGKSWGDECEGCPAEGTDEFKRLCGRKGLPPDDKHKGMNMDVNECLVFPTICANGVCRNTVGSFVCDCKAGYTLTADDTNCTDINECLIAQNACGNGTCLNRPGRFVCNCDTGFESTMMMQTCMDIDECTRDPTLCRGGVCQNTIGSFICVCPQGHELMPGEKACKDVDECSTDSSICSNGRCENFMGGYECICDPGFKENPLRTSCVDIDECRVNNGNCETTCVNTLGSYKCECMEGYTLGVDGKTCIDADECEEASVCEGGECINMPGTYNCRCTGGVMPSLDHKSCIDIDECRLNRNLCLSGTCKNTFGSFICDCPVGFSAKDGRQRCSDDDECSLGSDQCDINSACQNTQGSYKCTCNKGFTGNGKNCRDINECVEDNGGCSSNAGCINVAGSYSCVCDDGFEGNGRDCRDVDECTLDKDLCENGQCLNYPGGYSCECDMGFAPRDNGRECDDINECEMFRNLCVNGRCENGFGMYRCICNQGYELDDTGGNCTDLNECKDSQNCLHGTCVNRIGTYVCQCPPNHELSPTGNGCVDNRQGNCFLAGPRDRSRQCKDRIGGHMTKTTCCCTIGEAWSEGSDPCRACPHHASEEYRNLCVGGPGFRPNNVTVILEDIDECSELPGICTNGQCVNTFGSFTCTCQQGYEVDATGRICVDKDECENQALCGIGRCINSEGSYACVCPDGHMLTPDNNCMDMRPGTCSVQAYNHTRNPRLFVCDDNLRSNLTWKQCCCSIGQGWTVENEPCKRCPSWRTLQFDILCGERGKTPDAESGGNTDLNECALIPGLCENGICVNTEGSFRCDCPTGFQYINYRRICEDINECLQADPCVGLARCENTKGSFRCLCPDGYKLGPNRRDCVDVNECEQDGICENGRCRNLDGSFQCVCNTGYRLTSNKLTCLDVDECLMQPTMCKNGSCENTQGSYRCRCHTGFRLITSTLCADVNECYDDPSLCQNGRCVNTIGSFMCDCPTGYVASPDGQRCVDKDECVAMPGLCRHGRCMNYAGAFECECNTGFEPSRSGQECVDINECLTMPGACYNGDCRNSLGGFECLCPRGFVKANGGKKCMDMRKGYCFKEFRRGRCLTHRPMNVTRSECCCSKGAGWIPEDGGTACELCPEPDEEAFQKLCPDIGYITTPDEVPMDIDECANDPELCRHGHCINTDGSYRCVCTTGYKLDRTGVTCHDIDECRKTPYICGNGTCTNNEGSFVCSCRTGFHPGAQQTCEDIDECQEETSQCIFRCHNMHGTFKCTCPIGFQLSPDGRHCTDVDECRTISNKCRFACKNLVGSFMCVCPEGFRQVGSADNCQDIDECADSSRKLCENGRCVNRQGGYVCRCKPGYGPSPDRKYCRDERKGYCFATLSNGHCVARRNLQRLTKDDCCCINNAAWGPSCERCPRPGTVAHKRLCLHGPGYDKDGKDIDECARMPGACENGRCLNTMGSYRCLCKAGYQTDPSGSLCIDIDECSSNKTCTQECINTRGTFVCSCRKGFVLDRDGRTCNDIDECRTGQHNCGQDCINKVGGFMCGCGEGYIMKGSKCNDVDECAEDSTLCQPGGTCENTDGSYKCICPRGFTPDQTGKRCVDQDECDDEEKCQYGCSNIMGSYRCECPGGFLKHYQWNLCIDDNECNRQAGLCGGASCYNTVGSYECGCGGGQVFDPAALNCLGVGGGGCGSQPCIFGCTPTRAGFLCACPNGYQNVGQGHCIQTSSPPGSELPSGVVLPHVAAPDGEDSLPPGEGCYDCGTNKNGVPLEKPASNGGYGGSYGSQGGYQNTQGGYQNVQSGYAGYQNDHYQTDYQYYYGSTYGRKKRDVSEEQKLEKKADKQPVIGKKTRKLIDARGKKHQRFPSHVHPHQHFYGNSTAKGQKPVTLYVHRSSVTDGKLLLKWLPSLAALKNNEICEIQRGNTDKLFKLQQQSGVKFILSFTKTVNKKAIRNISIYCHPVSREGELINNNVKLVAFKLWVQLHIL